MSAILIVLSPFITSALTGLLKRLPAFSNLSDVSRTPAVRFLAAVLALGYTLVSMWMTGTFEPNMLGNVVNAVILSLLAWLGSLGVFHAFFQKKAA